MPSLFETYDLIDAPTTPQEDTKKKERTAVDGLRSFGAAVNNTLKTVTDLAGTDNPVSNLLSDNAKTWESNYSPAYREELQKQAAERAALGDDPSYADRALLAAKQTIRNPVEGLGEIAGNILPLAVGGLAGLGAKGMAALGVGMGAGAVKGSIAETIQNAPENALMSDPLYAQMRSDGMSEQDAKAKLGEQRASYDEAYGKILIGGALGGLVSRFGSVENALANVGKGAAAKGGGFLKSTGTGVAKEVGTEIPQEMTEIYLGNKGAAEQGAVIAPDQGLIEGGTKAGIMAAVGGGLAGATDSFGKPAETPPAPTPVDTIADQIQTQVDQGNSPLSRAAQAADPALAPDEISTRAREVETAFREGSLLDKLGEIGQGSVTRSEFLEALVTAKNKNLPENIRQMALDSLEQAMQWLADGSMPNDPSTGAPFSTDLATIPEPAAPGTDLATVPGGELATLDGPGFIDVEATEINENQIGGPRALPAPPVTEETQPSALSAQIPLEGPQDGQQNADAPVSGDGPGVASDQPAASVESGAGDDIRPGGVDAPGGATGNLGERNQQPLPQAPDAVAPAPLAAETQESPAAVVPVAPRKQVEAPQLFAPTGDGPDAALPAMVRKRKAQLSAMAADGFETVEQRGGKFFFVNTRANTEMVLDGMGDAARARVAIRNQVERQASTAAASPNNDRLNPTDAQIAAGNYKKSDVIPMNGMRVVLENPRGSVRSGTGKDGKRWSNTMKSHYGEIMGTEASDGDRLDTFIGPRPDTNKIFVVDQLNEDGSYDESKVMQGFLTEEEARQGYLENYDKGWTGLGAITEMTPAQVMAWAKSDLAKKPAAEYAQQQTTGATNDGRGSNAGSDTVSGPVAGGSQTNGFSNAGDTGTQNQRAGYASDGLPGAAAQQGSGSVPPAQNSLLSAQETVLSSTAHATNNQAAVASLDAASDIRVTAADPRRAETHALDALLDVFAKLTGKRGVAISQPGGGDGSAYRGNFFVNIESPHMNVAWSIGHEFKHLTENNPGLKKLYDRLWSMIDNEPGKQEYFAYLARTGQVRDAPMAQATAKELELLEIEMVADFMGKRFNDRAWLENLAKQKPNLFGEFIRDWLPMLDKLITALRGERERMESGAKNVDQYISQLEEAKKIATEVAIAWAERNPKLAQSTGADTPIRNSARAPAVNLKNIDLQKELDDEQSGRVSDEAIKAKGLMAEDAYPRVEWKSDSSGYQEVAMIPIDNSPYQQRVEMNQDWRTPTLWDASMLGTWVGPSLDERDGNATKAAVKAFVDRQAAGIDLRARNFDLASAVEPEKLAELVEMWKAIEATQGARKYGDVSSGKKSLENIAKEMGVTDKYFVKVNTFAAGNDRSMEVSFLDKKTGEGYAATLTLNGGTVPYLDANTLELGKSGLGGAFYQMSAEYAAANSLQLFPEDAVSGINSYRRTEQQISAALRTGRSAVMVPHRTQRVYGFENKPMSQAKHDANLGRLLLAGMRNAREIIPGFGALRYHPETDTFTNAGGKDMETAVKVLLASPDSRAFGMGRSTLARSVMTNMILKGELKGVTSFAKPVLYSARDTAEQEYKAVEAQYKGTPEWMKTPMGGSTMLTERQWVQVRTPSFINWFGDWQKGDIWNRDDVSKAVGSDGEPEVVYHGTDKGGFYKFKQPGGTKRGDLGIFTTSNPGMARSYVRKGRPQDFTPMTDEAKLADAEVELFEYQGRTSSKDTEDRTLYGYRSSWSGEEDGFASMAEAKRAILNLIDDGDTQNSKAGVYAAFVNIRNPYETNFEGALWNGDRNDQYVVVDDEGETMYTPTGVQFFNGEDAAKAFAKQVGGKVEPAPEHYETTDDAAREGRKYGHDGTIVREVVDNGSGYGYDLEPSDVFIANKPNQLKSADFNTGEFGNNDDIRYSKRDPAIGDRTDVDKLPKGKPIPESVAVGSLKESLALARSKSYNKGRELKVDIQARVLAAAKTAKVDLSDKTQETFKFLTGMVVQDAKLALESNANAIGWYDKTVSRAIGALATVHPEIETDPKSRLAFLWALATTSNGLKVGINFKIAEEVYRGWKETGTMPSDAGIGNAKASIDKGLALYNTLLDKMGHDRLFKFMATEFEVGQIGRMLGEAPGGEWMPTPVLGSAVLGPKIGNGFFSNLNGYFHALTMDRWLMRTWGRMTGTLIDVQPEKVNNSRAKLTSAISSMNDTERKLMAKLIGMPLRRTMTRAEIDAVSVAVQKTTMKPENRAIMDASPGSSRLRLDGNGHANMLDGQKEAPAGPAERNWIRAVFTKALSELNTDGKAMTMSDLQALLWYPERRLYDAAKSDEDVSDGYEDSEAPDYANAAQKLALKNGIAPEVIAAAMDRAEKRGTVQGERLDDAEKQAMLNEFRAPPPQGMQLAFEVAPDPADAELTAQWGQLPLKSRTEITKKVKDAVLDEVVDAIGVKVGKTVGATGGFAGFINPNLITEYKPTQVSIKQARALAAALGMALDQDSVALSDARASGTVGMVRITLNTKADKHAAALLQAIQEVAPGIDAFTARGNNFDILNFTDMPLEELHAKIVDAMLSLDIDAENTVSSGDTQSELVEKANYENHITGLRPGSGQEILARVRGARDRARQIVAEEIRGASDRGVQPGARSGTGRTGAARRDDVDTQLSARDRRGAGGLTSTGRESTRQDAAPELGIRPSAQGSQQARLEPLPGAPDVPGFRGPDPRLVSVAEQYARNNGIDLKRQAEYVAINEERAGRIASAYAEMKHAPNDPAVQEAYANLINQTTQQYQALANAGYKFWFLDLNLPRNSEYASTPWNAMRDVRANKQMGVFPTDAGFGSGDGGEILGNPLEADTGIKWPVGSVDGPLKPVLANDLFRAVHDAFGHGLEGAGFRAQGEENAWQAHSRLFTGSALGAITSETRGQNSWLNYGPHGENNRTAKVEDTIFADQKTGLMPEWTWMEGRAGDIQNSARDLGFYSELSNQIQKASMNQAPAGAWKSFIKALNQKGVKADEVEWTGVNDWLDLQEGKVPKQALVDYLDANGVQVEEVVLGAGVLSPKDERERQELSRRYEEYENSEGETGNWDAGDFDRLQEPEQNGEAGDLTKYGQYTLPGGENYREVLLTLPTAYDKLSKGIEADVRALGITKPMGDVSGRDLRDAGASEELMDRYYDLMKATPTSGNYQSSHWSQPNVLAHIRLNDRTDADGSKVLFVEEVQSDWGQDGKKKGFVGDLKGDAKEYAELEKQFKDGTLPESKYDRFYGLQDELGGGMQAEANKDGVPRAPFVDKTDKWLNLALKRIMRLAVDGDYAKVAFVNGEQSADRYDLSKSVGTIEYQKRGEYRYDIQVYDPVGQVIAQPSSLDADGLEQYVGKEMAKKIVDQATDKEQSLTGLDLKVGGEGMKAFYDKIVPNAASALLKKLGGGKMEVVGLPKPKEISDVSVREVAGQGIALFNERTKRFFNGNTWTAEYLEDAQKFASREQAKAAMLEMLPQESNAQPGFTITDAMREKVGAGVPLFSAKDKKDLAAKQAELKPSKYAGQKVVVPVKIEDTGEVASLTMDVDRTIDDYDSRTATLKKLLACL